MTVIKTIDKVKIPGTTTAGAHCDSPGDLGIGSCGQGRCFFMTHVQPVNLCTFSYGVRQTIKRVPHDTVDPSYPGRDQRLDEHLTNGLSHSSLLSQNRPASVTDVHECAIDCRSRAE